MIPAKEGDEPVAGDQEQGETLGNEDQPMEASPSVAL